MILYNGVITAEENLPPLIWDRAFLFGDGLFATVRVEQGKLQYPEAHLERLERDKKALAIMTPLPTLSQIEEYVERCAPPHSICKLKIIITGGVSSARGLPLREGVSFVTIEPYELPKAATLTLALYDFPVEGEWRRYKTLSYFPSLYLLEEAKRQDAEDMILFNSAGYLLETTSANLFWIDEEKRLCFPDRSLPYLFGTTLARVIAEWKGEVKESFLTRSELKTLPSLYYCNAMQGVRTVTTLLSAR